MMFNVTMSPSVLAPINTRHLVYSGNLRAPVCLLLSGVCSSDCVIDVTKIKASVMMEAQTGALLKEKSQERTGINVNVPTTGTHTLLLGHFC